MDKNDPPEALVTLTGCDDGKVRKAFAKWLRDQADFLDAPPAPLAPMLEMHHTLDR